jgi:hypothetical protein
VAKCSQLRCQWRNFRHSAWYRRQDNSTSQGIFPPKPYHLGTGGRERKLGTVTWMHRRLKTVALGGKSAPTGHRRDARLASSNEVRHTTYLRHDHGCEGECKQYFGELHFHWCSGERAETEGQCMGSRTLNRTRPRARALPTHKIKTSLFTYNADMPYAPVQN